MKKRLTFSITEPRDEDMTDFAVKAKRSYMVKAEQAFHDAWSEISKWIEAGNTGKKTMEVTIHVADFEYETQEDCPENATPEPQPSEHQ